MVSCKLNFRICGELMPFEPDIFWMIKKKAFDIQSNTLKVTFLPTHILLTNLLSTLNAPYFLRFSQLKSIIAIAFLNQKKSK